MTIGLGYDAHAFVEGRPLVLGGVTIPSDRGLGGHSDADVLTHAIVDAVLGAAALGDIGTHFPSNDSRWKDAPSLSFLAQVGQMLGTVWMRVASVDATVIMETPSLAPYREQMRTVLAHTLGLAVDVVSVKATTNDGMGFVGRGEGAAAIAIASVESTFGGGTLG